MNKFKTRIIETLTLYSLTLVLPITGTVLNIIVIILGIDLKYDFFERLYVIWIDYYFTGSLMNIDAWRIHIVGLILTFIFIKLDYDD